jgi:thiol-disulfide isomerase/thioredoxin
MKYPIHPQGSNKRFWSPLRLALTAVVLSLIAMGGVSSCTSSDEKTGGVATKPAAPAPAGPAAAPPAANAPAALASLPANILDVQMKTVDGGTMKLGDYSGKVLLVNLWATWCGHCRSEIPELVKLHKEFKAQGVEMVGLTTEDPVGSEEEVKSFVQAFQMNYHVGWAPREVAIALMQANQSGSIPQNLIISRDGHILRKFVGFNPIATPPQIRQALTDALNYKG